MSRGSDCAKKSDGLFLYTATFDKQFRTDAAGLTANVLDLRLFLQGLTSQFKQICYTLQMRQNLNGPAVLDSCGFKRWLVCGYCTTYHRNGKCGWCTQFRYPHFLHLRIINLYGPEPSTAGLEYTYPLCEKSWMASRLCFGRAMESSSVLPYHLIHWNTGLLASTASLKWWVYVTFFTYKTI